MRAILCKEYGPPEALVLEEVDPPAPRPGEVIVDVSYVGLNFHDTLIIANKHVVQPPQPFSPGSEYAGRVSAIGEGVTDIRIGDRVTGNADYGCARDRIAVPAERLAVIPDELSEEKAAAMLVTYSTAIHALKQRGNLQPDETLMVLGAAGGVGLAALELGLAMGARVIACASSADKCAFAAARGAHYTIDYGTNNLRDELKRITGNKGTDVVYDPVGGPLTEMALRSLGWKGRYLIVGFAGGEIPKIPMNLPLVKGCSISGVFVGDFMRREPQVHRQNLDQLFDWTVLGKFNPHIHAVYPFERYAEAWNVLARREARGKVLLRL